MIKSIKASVGSVKLHPIRLSYGLTPSDFDFEKRLLFVNRQLCRIAGQRFFIETPKSETGARTVPLTEKACQHLNHAIETRKLLCPWVFQARVLEWGAIAFSDI